jgi:hypothetical protein
MEGPGNKGFMIAQITDYTEKAVAESVFGAENLKSIVTKFGPI